MIGGESRGRILMSCKIWMLHSLPPLPSHSKASALGTETKHLSGTTW